ncbi:hypothetical protein SK128_004169 [Halocaridina rubra]|uniref:MARVEL domain-containing protein n=1 Tax=Halocaridina rubra TaxID=373956 RepID=A0AAN8WHJ9_HALRR
MAETGVAYVLTPRGILKILEFVLIVIVVGLWFGMSTGWRFFVTGAILSTLYSTIALGVQNIIMGPSRVAELILYGLQGLFLIISAIIIFAKIGSSLSNATGAFCIILGVVLGVDIFFTIKATDDLTS